VACSAFLFPANIENAESPLYKASDLIAEAKFIRKNSNFPAATAATYVVSVVSGFSLALMAIFSKVLMRRAAKLILFAGLLRCFVCSIVLFGISFSMIFIGAVIRESERGKWFLQSISESRIHLAWWCSALYLMIASSLIIFIASVGETLRRRRFGFGGKLCIHPKQLPTVHDAYLPTSEQVQWAIRVLDAAKAANGAAVAVDGKMVDRPVMVKAERLLQAASRLR
jgi:hypothetical protein